MKKNMKKIAILMALVMMVAMTAGVALAKEKAPKLVTLSGEVVKVDAATGMIVIKAENKDQEFKAEPKLLEGIGVGQKVTANVSGDKLASIKPIE